MASVIYPGVTGITDTASLDVFIPELWSDEIVAAYKSNLVMGDLVVDMPFVGKKGDQVHIPYPARASVTTKTETVAVTIIEQVEPNRTFTVDQHYEYSKFIEDFAATQAIDTYRQFYTDDAGYALAKQKDTWLWSRAGEFNGAGATPTAVGGGDGTNLMPDGTTGILGGALVGDGVTAWDDAASAGVGNAAALTDAGIRNLIQQLDDNDVPFAGRVLAIPPVEKNNILGVGATGDVRTYVRYDSTGEAGSANSLRNGLIGDIYGVEIYVSSNSLSVADSGGGTNDERLVILFQREGLILMQQAAPRVQTQYKQEYLATLFTADEIYGTGTLRPEAGIAVVVPA